MGKRNRAVDITRFQALVSRAFEAGAVYDGVCSMHWTASGDCDEPHRVEQVGMLGSLPSDWTAPPKRAKYAWRWVKRSATVPFDDDDFEWTPRFVEVEPARERCLNGFWGQIPQDRQFFFSVDVRCRKCEPCKQWRRRRWAARALTEMQLSTRTWFCTYTLRPRALMRAKVEAKSESYDAIARVMSKWFTKYMKRLRKHSKVPIRYFLVVEPHEGGGQHDGMPHLHALIHERAGEVGNRAIKGKWQRHGFSDCRLAVARDAHYVSKYVGKQIASRARASQKYGAVPDLVEFRSSIGSVTGEAVETDTVTNPPYLYYDDLYFHDVEIDNDLMNLVEGD